MATVDVTIANGLQVVAPGYISLFASIYGNQLFFLIHWIRLFFAYLFIRSLACFLILVRNKIGKVASIIGGAVGPIILLIFPGLLLVYLSASMKKKLVTFVSRVLGFLADGSISFLNPLPALITALCLLGTASYFLPPKTELKT